MVSKIINVTKEDNIKNQTQDNTSSNIKDNVSTKRQSLPKIPILSYQNLMKINA